MAQESGGGVNTTHKVGDGYGAMQITHNKTSIDQKSTADQISLLINEPVDKILTDHKTNIIAGAAWLAHLYKKNGGDVRATVRDYNGAGPMAEKYADQVMERYRKESDTVAVSKLAAKIQGSKQPLPMNW
jgi:soluble lytic murein transglycosylase-like protein